MVELRRPPSLPNSRPASRNEVDEPRSSKEPHSSRRCSKEGKEDPWKKFFKKFSDVHGYKMIVETPSDDRAHLCEEISRMCWERCQSEQEVLRRRVEDLNLNSIKQVTALKAQIIKGEAPQQASGMKIEPADLIEFYEPLKYMENTTKELVFTILADKMRQIDSGSAPKSLMKNVAVAGGDSGEWKAKYDEMEKRAQAAEESVARLGRQLAESEEQIQALQSSIRDKDQQLQDKQVEIEAGLEREQALQNRVSQLELALEGAKSQIKKLEEANQLLKEKVTALEQKQAELENEIEEHKATISGLQDQVETLEKELEEMHEWKRKAEEYQKQLENQIEELKHDLEVMTEKYEASQREVERLEARVLELEALNAELLERAEKAEEKLRQVQAELEAMTAKFEEAKREIERLEACVAELEAKNKALEKRAEEAEAKVREAQKEIDTLRKSCEQLQRRAETAEARAEKAEAERDELKAELARRNNTKSMGTQTDLKGEKLQERMDENKRLKSMLEEMKMKLQDLMNELKRKGNGDDVAELVERFGLAPLMKARTCFDRLYNDAMDRVHRMEKLKQKYAKEKDLAKYGLQIPGKEELLQAMENSNIEEDVKAEEKKMEMEKARSNLPRPEGSKVLSNLTPSLPQIAPAPPAPKQNPFAPAAPPSIQQQNFPWGHSGRSQSLDTKNFRIRHSSKVPETPMMLPSIPSAKVPSKELR